MWVLQIVKIINNVIKDYDKAIRLMAKPDLLWSKVFYDKMMIMQRSKCKIRPATQKNRSGDEKIVKSPIREKSSYDKGFTIRWG